MVGVDRPMKAPSKQIQKPYQSLYWKNYLCSHSCRSINKKKLNRILSYICSMCLYCIGKVSNCSIKTVVGVDRPMKALSMHIQSHIRENFSKFSKLSFCQKLVFLNQTPSCICSMCLYCIGKVSNCTTKSYHRS